MKNPNALIPGRVRDQDLRWDQATGAGDEAESFDDCKVARAKRIFSPNPCHVSPFDYNDRQTKADRPDRKGSRVGKASSLISMLVQPAVNAIRSVDRQGEFVCEMSVIARTRYRMKNLSAGKFMGAIKRFRPYEITTWGERTVYLPIGWSSIDVLEQASMLIREAVRQEQCGALGYVPFFLMYLRKERAPLFDLPANSREVAWRKMVGLVK